MLLVVQRWRALAGERNMLARMAVVGIAVLAVGSAVAAQDVPPVVDAQPMDVAAPVTGVTLYLGRASVTRSITVELGQGAFDLRFTNLPESIQPQTIQARGSDAVRVLGVDFAQEPVSQSASPELAA